MIPLHKYEYPYLGGPTADNEQKPKPWGQNICL